jgi:hypothetical protein
MDNHYSIFKVYQNNMLGLTIFSSLVYPDSDTRLEKSHMIAYDFSCDFTHEIT